MAFDPQTFFHEHPQAVIIGAGGLGLVVLLMVQGGTGASSKKPTAAPLLQNTNVTGQDAGNAYVSGTMLQNALDELQRRLAGTPYSGPKGSQEPNIAPHPPGFEPTKPGDPGYNPGGPGGEPGGPDPTHPPVDPGRP